jgi:hypothetical protein
VDIVGAADEMMMLMGVPTSPLLEVIVLLVIMMSVNYFTPSTTMGASS